MNITKAGYEPIETDVRSQIVSAGAAGMAGNVLVGGLIGVGVDTMTGATRGLTPNPVEVRLVPVNGTVASSALGRVTLASAAPVASLAAVTVENVCTQPSKVDQAECRRLLKMGMGRDALLAVLGAPDAKSADERTLRFGDRYLEFDPKNRLVGIREVLVPSRID